MNAFIGKAVCFWCFSAIGCGIFASADVPFTKGDEPVRETHVRASFLNFSDEIIELHWVDKDGGMTLIDEVLPYQSHEARTFHGHKFAYNWRGSKVVNRIDETNAHESIPVDEASGADPRTVDTSHSHHRLHVQVLGGLDQPQTKKVVCGTTKGDIHIDVKPFWSPLGAFRFLQLIANKDLRYFDGCALNRVVPGFLTQFGISAKYKLRTELRGESIPDDPQLNPAISFRPGYMSYAGSGPDSRSTEVFIVMPDTPASQLEFFGAENPWETPFGYVEPRDLGVVGSWYSYGDMAPWGDGPDPQLIYENDGYKYLEKDFPKMDYIKGCAIVPDEDVNDYEITSLSYEELAEYVFGEDEEEL